MGIRDRDFIKLRARISFDAKNTNPILAGSFVGKYNVVSPEQLGMFGDAPTTSLYVPIARILAAAEKRLRDEKRTFRTLSERAGAIEGAGNVLDRGANQEAAY